MTAQAAEAKRVDNMKNIRLEHSMLNTLKKLVDALGGAKMVAPAVGVSVSHFQGGLNVHDDTHRISYETALNLLEYAYNNRNLPGVSELLEDWLIAEHKLTGMVPVRISQGEVNADAIHDSLLDAFCRAGILCNIIRDVVVDNEKINPDDDEKISNATLKTISALLYVEQLSNRLALEKE